MPQSITMALKKRAMIFVASDLLRSTTGSTFTVHFRGEDLGQFQIPSFGRHNIMNATAVVGLLYIAGFDLDLVREHLKNIWRGQTSLYRKDCQRYRHH